MQTKRSKNLPNFLDFYYSLLQRRTSRSCDGEEGRQAYQGACHHRFVFAWENEPDCWRKCHAEARRSCDVILMTQNHLP